MKVIILISVILGTVAYLAAAKGGHGQGGHGQGGHGHGGNHSGGHGNHSADHQRAAVFNATRHKLTHILGLANGAKPPSVSELHAAIKEKLQQIKDQVPHLANLGGNFTHGAHRSGSGHSNNNNQQSINPAMWAMLANGGGGGGGGGGTGGGRQDTGAGGGGGGGGAGMNMNAYYAMMAAQAGQQNNNQDHGSGSG